MGLWMLLEMMAIALPFAGGGRRPGDSRRAVHAKCQSVHSDGVQLPRLQTEADRRESYQPTEA